MLRDPFAQTNEESGLIRAWDALRRRRTLAAVVFATLMASAVSFARYLPDLYQASALVLVERPVLESAVRPAISGELEGRLHVIKQEILSRGRLTELIERFNLYPERRRSESLDSILDQTRKDILVELNGPEQVSGRTKTVAFRLSYTGEAKTTVADVTNAIAAFYVNQNERMQSESATRTTDFLKTQLLEAKKQLGHHEQNLRAYTSTHVGELPQQVGVNLATLERLNDQLRLNGEQQLRVLEQRERLLEGLSPAEPGAPPSTAATLAPTESFEEKSLEQMKQDLQQAEARFMAKHPDVIRLKEQVAALEKEVETRQAERRALESSEKGPEPPRTVPAARRRALENINTELERLKKAEADAREIIVSTERRLEGVPARQQEFQLLSRDHQAAKEQYDSLMKRYDEAQLTESMEVDRQGERFRILEPALAPDGPTAPNRPRLLILGFLFAVAAAGAAVLLAEQFDTSFHSVDDLRSFTRIPVLASIPHVGPASGTRLAFTAASALAVIALVAVLSARVASGNEQLVRLLVRAS